MSLHIYDTYINIHPIYVYLKIYTDITSTVHLSFARFISISWLVVWNMAFMTFHVLGTIIPFDYIIFFRRVGIPPTSIMSVTKYDHQWDFAAY